MFMTIKFKPIGYLILGAFFLAAGCSEPTASNEAEIALMEKKAYEQQIRELTTSEWSSETEFLADLPDMTGKPFDVVILNGRIMDPASGLDAVRNIGIVENRIASVTDSSITGSDTIDAAGLVVAPGFIDTHTHATDLYATKIYIRDGVTSSGDLEHGSLDVNAYFENRSNNSLINHFTGASHEFARHKVMDRTEPASWDSTFLYPNRALAASDGTSEWAERMPTDEELDEIKALLERGLKDGALTISTLIGYFPQFAKTSELWELQKLAHKYGKGFSGHFRMLPHGKPPVEYIMGYKEALANAAALGQPLLFSHNNNNGWQELHEMVEFARANGMLIWDEQYPYAAGGPNIGAPPISLENLKSWDMTPEEVMFSPELNRFYTTEEYLKAREETPEKIVIWFARDEEWPAQLCATAGMTLGNDSFTTLNDDGTVKPIETPYEDFVGHPRGAGNRATCFKFARELDIPLMLVINNASTMSAKMLCKSGVKQMCERGRVQEGMIADLTLFDPETITPNSDYLPGKQGLPTTGIPYVLVNGKVAVRDSKVDLTLRAGEAIRQIPE